MTKTLTHADLPTIERWMERIIKPLELYHRYEIRGLEILPREGPCLLVFSHSLATYDAFMFGYRLHRDLGIDVKALGDNLIFKLPYVGEYAAAIGIIRANPEDAEELLKQDRIVAVAPGGMREALRPSHEKYRVLWQKRKGFVKLAIKMQVPIYLIACPSADDIYSVYENTLTKIFYKKFKVPVPFIRGWGLTLIPRPVKLIHYVKGPYFPPKVSKGNYTTQVNLFHDRLKREMVALMTKKRS